MRSYILKKLAIAVLVFLGVYTIVFLLCFMMPGDPVRVSMGLHSDPQAVELLTHAWGLDEPRYVQYFSYLKCFVMGDWGISFRYEDKAVLGIILDRLPRTAYLGLWGIIFSVILSIPLGVIAAYKQNKPPDNAAVLISQIGVSLPNFWLGLMLIAIVAVGLRWISPIPQVPHSELWSFPGFFTSLKPYSLAIITLGTGMMATTTRLTRSSMLEIIRQDYITMLRAKGMPEHVVILKHALRNALIPVVTIVGMQVLILIGGVVLTETVFAINGLGRLYVDAITARDYPIITALTLVYAAAVVIMNLIVDLSYSLIDPRVKLG